MSDLRNGNGNGDNQLGGGMNGGALGSAPLPTPGGDSDSIDVPGVGSIQRGASPIHTEHAYHKAVYNKLISAGKMLDHMRGELDKLSDMGDTVTPEDVIAAAGRLVGHGVPARELASILSEMPAQAGQGLAAWVAQSDQALTQQEAEVARVTDIAANRMAQSAVRVIATEHLMGHARNLRSQLPGQGQLGPAQQQAIKKNPMGPTGPAAAEPQPQIVEMMSPQAGGQLGPQGGSQS